ncbi:substrate-binding domain-containing protein [Portibacter marinus]|uniref:substrate-binding domain-containing protein n=1 Tax=Portibacter marinus TaxID=2898660 RepID=UPI001F1D804A|nr:LacI family DNA-binding transcriptional regulator [Portibacter marinus]
MTQRIRIKDIAQKAGVSPGTVDRVLHERGNVSAKARAKVKEALQSLDYSPNVLASILAYNKNWKIAALLPRDDHDQFWSQPKEGILNALKAVKDYGIIVDFFQFYENDLKDFHHQCNLILEGQYEAVIITPIFTEQSLSFLECLELNNTPFVQINTLLNTEFEHQICYIGQDSYHSGKLGAKLLAFGVEDGQKVMITHLEELVYNSQHLIDKEQGFKDFFSALPSKSIEVVTSHFANPYHQSGLRQFFKAQLEEHPEIKGIFVTTSRGFRVVKALDEIKRQDLKVVGFDLIDENVQLLIDEKIDFLINQNPYKQGYLAIINIFNFLIRKISPVSHQFLPLDVVMKENATYYSDRKIEEIPIVL